MVAFLARRLVQAAVIVFIVVTATFFLVRLAPGDPFANRFETPVPQEFLDAHREHWGLNEPLGVQYSTYVANLLRGDFGHSFRSRRPVLQQLSGAMVNTVVLGMAALLINFSIGIGLGALQARKRETTFDRGTSVAALVLMSFPVFWLGILASHVFGNLLNVVPQFGVFNSVTYHGLSWFEQLLQRLHHLILPASVLGFTGAAWTSRYMRAQTVDMSTQPHVQTARSKGLTSGLTFARHVARNALVPIVTLFGISLPALLSGAVFIEVVFSWNGLGREAAIAAEYLDYPMITAITTITATLVVAGNIVADVLYRVVDPRIQSTS